MEVPSVSRIRDAQRQENVRKKKPSDSAEAMKERNKKRKDTEKVTGNIRFYVNTTDEKTELFNKMDSIKILMGEKISKVSNKEILDEVFDFYMKAHQHLDQTDDTPHPVTHSPFVYCKKEDTGEQLYVSTLSGLRNICYTIQSHRKQCDQFLDISEIQHQGHAGKLTLLCSAGHTFKCDTSPHMEGGKLLVNMRFVHAVMSTGLRFSVYERFCNASKIGICPESYFDGVRDIYCDITSHLMEQSVSDAVDEEVNHTLLEVAEVYEETNTEEDENDEHMYDEYKGICIITDARHGWRRNAAQSDIVAIGLKSHKVVGVATVTHEDDPVSQRHELIGAKKLYEQFNSKGINVDVHGHDRNASVNKYIREEHPLISNANDTWHAAKGIAKEMKKITSGAKKYEGINWHPQLSDKAASIKTHCYYAMKTCSGSSKKLTDNLDNIIEHYKDNHTNCSRESRCITDQNYVPSKEVLTHPKAIMILHKAIKSLQIYKTPQDYVKCIDTHYVESFNNAILVYQDKRIVFSHKEYKRRTNLAVLDWNENVNRDFTSITRVEDVRNPRRQTGLKNLKPKTFEFVNTIWKKIISHFYDTNM